MFRVWFEREMPDHVATILAGVATSIGPGTATPQDLLSSVGEADAVGVEIQGRVGGQIVETLADGRTSVWGTVTTWDPPHHVAFTWHPGRPAAEKTFSPPESHIAV